MTWGKSDCKRWQRVGAESEKVFDRVRRNEHKNGKSKFTCEGRLHWSVLLSLLLLEWECCEN